MNHCVTRCNSIAIFAFGCPSFLCFLDVVHISCDLQRRSLENDMTTKPFLERILRRRCAILLGTSHVSFLSISRDEEQQGKNFFYR